MLEDILSKLFNILQHCDGINIVIRELDDVSRYIGHHDPTFTWKTEMHGKDTGTSWFTAASKDVVSRPRMAAAGLATVLKQMTGQTVVYIATTCPPIHVDKDWDCSATTWSSVLIVPGDVLYVTSVHCAN